MNNQKHTEATKSRKFKDYMVSSDGAVLFQQAPTTGIVKFDIFFNGSRVAAINFERMSETQEVSCDIVDTAGKAIEVKTNGVFRNHGDDLDLIWGSGVNTLSDRLRRKLRLKRA